MALLVVCLGAAAPLSAQTVLSAANPEFKQQHDVLFAEVMKNPADVDVGFRYAEAATRIGDFEAAIGALERIIFYQPNLPRVRLELGVLYFRLGSYEMARSYFETAISGADTPFEVRSRVGGFLVEIDRRLQTTQWSFAGHTGLRYQTNANSGPISSVVRALGFDATLTRQFTRRPDWSAFVSGTLRHVYDFENQRGDVLESQLTTYYSRQFKFDRLNLGLIEASVGPRLAIAPDLLPGWSVKAYGILAFSTLADKAFMTSPGAGVTVAIPLTYALIEPGYEIRRRGFRNSIEYPTARDQTGLYHSAYVNFSGVIVPELRWNVRLGQTRSNVTSALFEYNASRGRSIDMALAYEFDPVLVASARRWTFSPFLGYTRTAYDAPNALVDPGVRRNDREWRVGAVLDAPVWVNAGIGVVVQYTNVKSSLPNYATRNFSVTFGPTVRF